jgi:hypothetical protein
MPAIPTAVPIPKVLDLLDEHGRPKDPAWDRRFGRFAAQIEWYAEALKAAREKGTPY